VLHASDAKNSINKPQKNGIPYRYYTCKLLTAPLMEHKDMTDELLVLHV